MIKAVIFDLDGTLVDLPIDYEVLFEEFKLIMNVDKVRPVVDTVSKIDGKTRELVFNAWDKAELDISEKISPNNKGMKIYKQCDCNQRVLVTLQGKAIVEKLLKKYSLRFDFVLTREDSLFRAEQLTKAITHLEVDSCNVLFVGNTKGDAEAAKKAGCLFQMV